MDENTTLINITIDEDLRKRVLIVLNSLADERI